MRMKFIIVMALIYSNTAFSKTDNNVEKEEISKDQAKAVMGGIYSSFLKVIPYLYSDENSIIALKKDKAKKSELLKDLTDLSEFFQSAKHIEYLSRPGFKPSLESMNSHLSDTINSVKSDNFIFAQKRLGAMASLCISCHSQLSSTGAQNAFGEALSKTKREAFESDFAYGNYLYLIRQFDESEKYLNLSIERALSESRSHELYSSLRRVISIHTKISFNFLKANNFINKYKNDKRMPSLAKATVTAWGKSLEEWRDFNPSSVTSVDSFIKKYLSPLEDIKEIKGLGDNDMTLLISSGILSKYLNDNPSTEYAPQILYWLSVAEKRLSNTFFFTLSDLYLKNCIKLYSTSPYARKCYNLYEENLEFGFTGSAGKDLPSEEKVELARLRSLLK